MIYKNAELFGVHQKKFWDFSETCTHGVCVCVCVCMYVCVCVCVCVLCVCVCMYVWYLSKKGCELVAILRDYFVKTKSQTHSDCIIAKFANSVNTYVHTYCHRIVACIS